MRYFLSEANLSVSTMFIVFNAVFIEILELNWKTELVYLAGKGCSMRGHVLTIRPQGYKTFSMLNSTAHEILTAHKN